MKKVSTFLSWIVRMSLIKRWALMLCIRQENVSEHSHQVAVIAHMLAVIKNKLFEGNINADRVATIALYHEISETKLQDLNSNTKYQNPEFTAQFKKLEKMAEYECLDTLPSELHDIFEPLVVQDKVDQELKKIVKAADILAAFIKAQDELRFQNQEFLHVKNRLTPIIKQLCTQMPEVEYFTNVFLPGALATADNISGKSEL